MKYYISSENIISIFLILGIFFGCAFNLNAEKVTKNSFYISGDVFDLYTLESLKGTVTEVLTVPDSIVVTSGKRTNRYNGEEVEADGYSVKIPNNDRTYILRFVREGYEPFYRNLDATKFGKKTSSVSLDPVYLERKAKTLSDVNVVASKIKFYHRGDTLVYNADAFVLPEGSMLDALLEQLPGVQMDGNGEIKVNGKRVDYLLLDGKEFFSHDRRLMLKNIASYTVKNIEVYESLDSRFSDGLKGHEQLLMDVKLKKEYQKGYITNIEGGYGTSGRYMGRLFSSIFTKNLNISLIGAANNLNDERLPGESGTWNPEKLSSGNKESALGGINYNYTADENRFRINGNVNVNYSDLKDVKTTNITNFLPGGNNYTYRFNRQNLRNLDIGTYNNFSFDRKWGYFKAMLGIGYVKNINESSLREATVDKDVQNVKEKDIDNIYEPGNILNAAGIVNRLKNDNDNDTHKFFGNLSFSSMYRFKKYRSSLLGNIEGGYEMKHEENSQSYLLNFGQGIVPIKDFRRNFRNYPDHNYRTMVRIRYNIRPTEWMMITEGYEYEHKGVTATSNVYLTDNTDSWGDYDNASMRENMPVRDDSDSFRSHQYDNTHRIINSFAVFNDDISASVDVPISFQNRKLAYKRAAVDTVFSHLNVFPEINFTVIWDKKNIGILDFHYFMDGRTPEMTNFVDMRDSTDPLNIYIGNSNLRRRISHKWSARWWKRHKKTMQSIEISYQTIVNALVRGFDYNKNTGVRIFKPLNISGDNEWWARYKINSSFGPQSRFTIDNDLEYLRRTNHDLVSEDGTSMQRSRVRNLRFRDKLSLSYNINGNRISAFGTGAWNRYTGSLASFNAFNAWDINYGVTGTFKLPYNFGLTTDFTVYMRRGFNDDALNTNNYVWNARLSWSTLKGNLLFMVDGWDILHNIKNITYSVNTQGRTETYTSVLPRYVMFHIQYRFNKQPKKK